MTWTLIAFYCGTLFPTILIYHICISVGLDISPTIAEGKMEEDIYIQRGLIKHRPLKHLGFRSIAYFLRFNISVFDIRLLS